MLINVSDDINIIINRYLDINSILLLRKSYRCNYKITKEHNFVRIINIENNFSINKNDKYNIELKNYESALKSYEEAQNIYPTMEAAKKMIPLIKEFIKGQKT